MTKGGERAVDLWSKKTIPEEWDTDWPAQKPSLSIYAHWWDGDIENFVTPLSLKSKEEIQTFEYKFGGIEDGIE